MNTVIFNGVKYIRLIKVTNTTTHKHTTKDSFKLKIKLSENKQGNEVCKQINERKIGNVLYN